MKLSKKLLNEAHKQKQLLRKIQKPKIEIIPLQEIPPLYEHNTKQLIIQFTNQTT